MNIFELPVYEPADIPPMRDDDGIALLAESIKLNGLQQPITIAEVDGEWMLVDGRNRREACKIAGVEPDIKKLNGADPMITVLSSNDTREMGVGRRAAMVVMQALKCPQCGQWGESSKLAATSGIHKQRISEAFLINEYLPKDLHQIVHGTRPFTAALKAAKELKKQEERGGNELEWLRDKAPDLAKKVEATADLDDDSRYDIDDAIAAAEARIDKEQSENKNYVTSVMHGLKSATNGLTAFEKGDALDAALKLAMEHSYCKEEMERYFTESELYALKNKATAITAGAKQITTFLKGL